MRLLESVKDFGRGIAALASGRMGEVLEMADQAQGEAEVQRARADYLREEMNELELAIDSLGWEESRGDLAQGKWQLSKASERKLRALSRRMYLKSPLMKRSVDVQALYVFGLGVTIKAKNKDVQEALTEFLDDPKNMAALTSQPALMKREQDQQITGNNYIGLFVNRDNGRCRVRILPVEQMESVCNPDDANDILFYKRVWSKGGKEHITCYPSITHQPDEGDRETVIKGDDWECLDIDWDSVIVHVVTGNISEQSKGLPEYFSIMDWIVDYKRILNNWSSIMSAYARLAMKVSGNPGKKGNAASKTKMGTSVSLGSPRDTTPPNNTAGWFMASGGIDVTAIKTAGATTGPSEAKPLLDMVAAGAGIPNTFYGNADQGNFATSTTLDRPTELGFTARQKLWMAALDSILNQVVLWSAEHGLLAERSYGIKVIDMVFDSMYRRLTTPEGAEDPFIEITFPPILERSVVERVRAVVQAATLGGSSAEGIIPDRRFVSELLLMALDVEEREVLLADWYPEGREMQGYVDPVDKLKVEQTKAQGTADIGTAALDQAATAKKVAAKPAPKVARPANGGVSNRR